MQQDNKTWLGSVLLTEIQLFDGLPVDRQNAAKRDLKHILYEHLKRYDRPDYEIYDSESGYALCYLGKPENLLQISMELRNNLAEVEKNSSRFYSVRMAINCPVRLVASVNGERVIEGHGIKHARRVVEHAGTNQLLISRSYYDILSCVSEDYHKLFHCIGRHGDKNVRRNIIYEVVNWWDSHAGTTEEDKTAYQEILETEPEFETIESNIESQRASSAYSLKMLDMLEHELAHYVGPMAKFIVNEAVQKCRDFDALCRTVAEDIPTPSQRAMFLDAVGNKLGH